VILTWRRLASGNYAAFGEGGWFYLAGRLDSGWFLEEGPADDAGTCETVYRLRTLGAAQAEAEEQEETSGLLCGRYNITRPHAAELMAAARKHPDRACFRTRYQTVQLGTDAGGYTVEVLDAV
jgi:hypothetical protein